VKFVVEVVALDLNCLTATFGKGNGIEFDNVGDWVVSRNVTSSMDWRAGVHHVRATTAFGERGISYLEVYKLGGILSTSCQRDFEQS
jgi:hypothetical protein